MERNRLKEEIENIKMPLAMQERILENCRTAEVNEKENIFMAKNTAADTNRKNAKNRTGKKWPRIATVAAAVALCLGLGGITVMAGSDKLEGFFADVTRWDGAVVGTTYEQATEEITVNAAVSGDCLVVDAVLLKAEEAPYAYIEGFGVQKYHIADAKGDVVAEGISSETVAITDGKVSVALSLDELESGNYTLIITEFVGTAKADQDLPIKGYWECKFEL
ncbi:MAG: hypothetical protein IJ397_00435 [Lachnospiraceae bacterium]|nr:hypothetical protein [Lachnospiraceae bacterium]